MRVGRLSGGRRPAAQPGGGDVGARAWETLSYTCTCTRVQNIHARAHTRDDDARACFMQWLLCDML